ncbi:DNA polymerase-3 subunit beta [Paenibacillus sp. V4I7]|nr:DNA polymerase-3 subunit beta [Paenibacillus sp. V4I7]
MLVNISKDSLINALQHVLRAVSSNNTIPILSGICIQACVNEIVFTASNTSMRIQFRIPRDNKSLNVHRTGSIVVPARYFNEVIRKLTADIITFEINKPLILTIVSGKSQIRLCGMDPEEFPLINNQEHNPDNKLRINNALLKATIKQVATAASTSEMRPVLTGVSFDYNNDSVNLIATDGIRLASKIIHTEKNTLNTSTKFLIPAKNLYEVSKMLRNDDDATEIDVIANQVRFTANELQVESALIEGTFPSITNVIPQSYLSEVLVDTTRLLRAVECVTVLAGESIIRLLATTSTLELLSRTAEIGDVQDEVPLMEMSGDDFSISLNGRFFIDILRSIDSEHVRIRFTGKASPVVIIPEIKPSSTLFLITPVRTHS